MNCKLERLPGQSPRFTVEYRKGFWDWLLGDEPLKKVFLFNGKEWSSPMGDHMTIAEMEELNSLWLAEYGLDFKKVFKSKAPITYKPITYKNHQVKEIGYQKSWR